MLFDTDVLIALQRGSQRAARIIRKAPTRAISVQTYMELLQGATDKAQHRTILSFLKTFHFTVLPLTENIGHRAAIYVEEYALSHHMHAGDALVAATAVENALPLCSSNARHYKAVTELQFKRFSQ